MIEIIALALVPLAAWGGWKASQSTRRHGERKRSRVFNNQYFQGLNYLLNEQPDKAIQIFLEMAEVNKDTVETHLALGSLFRRRGEVDRAIRIHQNIISEHALDDRQRLQALLELGEDYMRAGLFDRAEKLFSELTERESQAPSALRHLLDIYQQEKDWQRALDTAQRLEAVTEESFSVVQSHFCCELAVQALDSDRPDKARKFLRQARRFDPENVRSQIIAAEIARHHGRFEEAVDIYEEVVALDRDYLPYLLDHYLACAGESNNETRSRNQIDAWSAEGLGTSVLLREIEFIEQERGASSAARLLAKRLRDRPSMRGLDRLLQLRADEMPEGDEITELLHGLTGDLLKQQATYRCTNCGFGGQNHHWQCPSCRNWSTTRVVRGVLGE